jgi:ketosteroid isomerase-like protein
VSQENVEIVRRMFEAYAHGGFAAAATFAHPDFEMSLMADHPLGGRTYRAGEAGDAMLDFVNSFQDFRASGEEFIDAGDRVIVAVRERGKAREGVEFEQTFGVLYTLHDGKVSRMEWFDTPAEALKAVGLEE